MYKNLKTPAVEHFENGNYHVYRKLFPAKQHFSNGSQRHKIARIGKQTE